MEGLKSMLAKSKETRIMLMENYLKNLAQKKPFEIGDVAITLHGPHAFEKVRVLNVKENGMVEIVLPSDASNKIEMSSNDLYHSDDYYKAFETALREEPRESRRPS